MNDVMMQLGDYIFSIPSACYQKLERTTNFLWSQNDKFEANTSYQWTGFSDELVLSGVVLPLFAGGIKQLDAMRSQGYLKTPLQLVDGLGNIWGDWVILQVKETQSEFISHGVAQQQQFSLKLAYYDALDYSPTLQEFAEIALKGGPSLIEMLMSGDDWAQIAIALGKETGLTDSLLSQLNDSALGGMVSDLVGGPARLDSLVSLALNNPDAALSSLTSSLTDAAISNGLDLVYGGAQTVNIPLPPQDIVNTAIRLWG